MRKTLQQLQNDFRILISQTDENDTDFTSAEITGFLNQGVQYLASLVEYPRDIMEIQVQDNYAAYTLPSDTMKLRTAYFGDRSITGDWRPISVIFEERLNEIYPSWGENTDDSKGRPEVICLLDRQTVLIHPRPNAVESVTGKKLYLGYVYYPAALVNDGDYPDLPNIYHQFVPLYAAHLAYMGKLKNVEIANGFLKQCIDKAKSVQPQATNEITDLYFSFGNDDEEPVSGLAVNRFL